MKHFSKINYLAVGLASILLFSGCGKVVDTYPVDVLKNETTTSPILTATTTDSALSPQKIEVTSENWAEHDKEFATLVASGQDPNLNTEPTTTTVPYINFEQGFEVQIPYSKNWGTEKMYPKPFEFFNPKSGILPPYLIKFGPLVVTGEGEVGLGRPYFIALSKHRDIDQVESDFKKEISDYDLGSDKWPSGEKLTINGLSVFHGMHSILCEHHEFEVVGKNYNVIVGTMCDDSQEAEKVLLQVVKSMKFFDPNRIVLDEHNIGYFNEDYCGGDEFNNAPPTKKIMYTNNDKGFSLQIPYNPNWKFERFVLAPYFDYEWGIEFGMPLHNVPESGCEMHRYFNMHIESALSGEEIITEASDLIKKPGYAGVKMTTSTENINGLSVLKIHYEAPQPAEYFSCDNTDIYVLGKKYNYHFYADCIGSRSSEVDEIMRTMKLL